MNLTQEYRSVRAVFEEHQNIPELQRRSAGIFSKFQVGLFEYVVLIGPTRGSDVWAVSFQIQNIHGTPQELAQEFSQIYKKKISPKEAMTIRQRLLSGTRMGRTETGRSSEVLGHVLSVVNEFINYYHPRCIRFEALEPSRQSLYLSIIKRFLPDWVPQQTGNTFTVCQKTR